MFYTIFLFAQVLLVYISVKIYLGTPKVTIAELSLLLLFLLNNTLLFPRIGTVALIGQLFFLFLIIYVNKRDWQFSLSALSVVLVGNIIADHLGTFFITSVLHANAFQTFSRGFALYFLLTVLFSISIMILARKFYQNNEAFLLSSRGKNLFTLATTAILTIFYLNIVLEIISGNQKNIIELNLLFFAATLLVSVVSISSYIQSIRRSYETEQKKQELKMMRTYTEKLEQQFSEIRKFRHDYQNILTSLEGYIVKQDYENLESYFFENIKPTGKQIQQNIFVLKDLAKIKIESVKSLIATKGSIAQEKNIDVIIEITELIESINISDISLIRMLGIILDNALEAVDNLENKQLSIAFIKDKTSVHIIVENTCSPDLPKLHVLKKEGFSTKGSNRGIGLSNLQDLINATPNSSLVTKIENNRFSQELTIMD